MTRGLLNVLTALSLLLCVAVLVLWVISVDQDADARRYLPLGGDARAALWDERLSIYNTDLPYNGSIVGVAPGGPVLKWHWNFPVYFRYFEYSDRTMWVLTIPLYLPFLLSAAPPLLWLRRGFACASAPPAVMTSRETSAGRAPSVGRVRRRPHDGPAHGR